MSAVEQQVDIVLPWVDGADPVWRSLRTQYSKELGKNDSANTEIRYQSWDNLQYWFRAIETCMPWYIVFF